MSAKSDVHEVIDAQPIIDRVAFNVRLNRTVRGMSLSELSAKTNLSKSYLSTLEAGKNNPSLGVLLALASTFGCTVEELMGEPMYVPCHQCGGVGFVEPVQVSDRPDPRPTFQLRDR